MQTEVAFGMTWQNANSTLPRRSETCIQTWTLTQSYLCSPRFNAVFHHGFRNGRWRRKQLMGFATMTLSLNLLKTRLASSRTSSRRSSNSTQALSSPYMRSTKSSRICTNKRKQLCEMLSVPRSKWKQTFRSISKT